VPATNAPGRDLVMTPPDLSADIIAHFAARMAGRVLDPAKGQGAFYGQFPAYLERHWCEIGEPGKRMARFPAWAEIASGHISEVGPENQLSRAYPRQCRSERAPCLGGVITA
jgi:hypothetical protein